MDTTSRVLKLPEAPRDFALWIDGRPVEAGDREIYVRHSPAHEVPVTRIPMGTAEDLDTAVAAARRAFDDRRWSGLSGADRAAVLLRAADGIRARAEELAYWETLENGKPIAQARAEVGGCPGMYEYAAGVARSLHGDSFNNLGDGMMGFVTREPIGVVGIITPWNFPFLILNERVPYILAAGCTMVAKPSEFTSATSLILGEILAEAGVPDGVFNVVPGLDPVVGQAMAEHTGIDMLSFTGSTRTGRGLLSAAGSNFKKLGLELGGKNPQIVFADADLEDAADGVAEAGVPSVPRGASGITLNSYTIRPKSRGTVRLRSSDPDAPVRVDPNFLAEPEDLKCSVEGVRLSREIFSQPSLQRYVKTIRFPDDSVKSQADLEAYARQYGRTSYHPTCTCRMGVDEMAVVDPSLRVHGIDGLRICDSSAMPGLIGSNTNAPTIMIAEKASDLIRGNQ